MLCHVAKYSVHVAKYSVVKCLINVAKVQVLTIALQGEGRRSWRKTKKRMQQVHPLYSSPDLVAAPVESVVEFWSGGLSGTRPMRQVQLTSLTSLAICAPLRIPWIFQHFPDTPQFNLLGIMRLAISKLRCSMRSGGAFLTQKRGVGASSRLHRWSASSRPKRRSPNSRRSANRDLPFGGAAPLDRAPYGVVLTIFMRCVVTSTHGAGSNDGAQAIPHSP